MEEEQKPKKKRKTDSRIMKHHKSALAKASEGLRKKMEEKAKNDPKKVFSDDDISIDFETSVNNTALEKSEDKDESALDFSNNDRIPTAEERELMTAEQKLRGYYEMINSQNVWGHNKAGVEAIKASMSMLSTKTGMFARIPIYCKGDTCPYGKSCGLVKWGISPIGQACPVEIATIQRSWEKYWDEFALTEEDFTDIKLVQEIIKMEVYMERCTGLMSKEVTPVQLMVVGTNEDGEPIETPQVSKSVEAYERYSKIRDRNYSLLMATRKDKIKKGDDKQEKSLMDILAEVDQDEDFYNIETRPEHIDGID